MNQNINSQPIIVNIINPTSSPASTEDSVFTKEQEEAFGKYLQVFYTNTNSGIDGPGVKKLAYEVALLNKLNIPNSWKSARMATEEWLEGYQYRRHLAHAT